MRAFLRFCPLMGSSHIAGLKIACWDSRPTAKKLAGTLVPRPKNLLGRGAKAALCRGGLSKGALAGMTGVAVGAVPAEASCPPGGRRPWRQLASKEEGLLKNDGVVWGGAPTPKCLGAKAFTLEAAYPSKGVTCATASAWVISASPLSKSSRRYFQLPMPSSCIYES